MNWIAPFVPIFLLFIAVEILVDRKRGSGYYRLNDSFSNLSMGMFDRLVSIVSGGGLLALYILTFERMPYQIDYGSAVLKFIVAFIFYDFAYYWFHRTSHFNNFFWGSHIGHHNSEEYNFTVALRQGAFQKFFSFWFAFPMCFLGIDPYTYISAASINTVYQFFIHTRYVGKLGFLESFMNTPSHHRVHHAKDPKYWDKNFAGVFIIWDKIFRTFKEEQEEPRYGVAPSLKSFNPVWSTFHWWQHLIERSLKLRSLKDLWKLWMSKPGVRIKGEGPREKISFEKYDPQISPKYQKLAILFFVLAFVTFMGLFYGQASLSLGIKWAAACLAFLFFILCGKFLSSPAGK